MSTSVMASPCIYLQDSDAASSVFPFQLPFLVCRDVFLSASIPALSSYVGLRQLEEASGQRWEKRLMLLPFSLHLSV